MRSSCTLINYVAVHLLFMCSDPILKCQEPFVRFDPTCTLFKSAIFLRVNMRYNRICVPKNCL